MMFMARKVAEGDGRLHGSARFGRLQKVTEGGAWLGSVRKVAEGCGRLRKVIGLEVSKQNTRWFSERYQ